MRSRWSVMVASWICLAGCGDPPAVTGDGGASIDAAKPRAACPSSEVLALPTCGGWPIPEGGCRVKELDTAPCDSGGATVRVGPSVACRKDVTVVFAWGGWCDYCQQVARKLPALVTRYRGKSVRFVGNLSSTVDVKPPTTEFCGQWRTQYSLDGVELGLDPDQNTVQTVLREQGVIDRHGRLRGAFDRDEKIIDQLTAAIDDVLANPD